jgi:hypothetical protein
MLNDDKIAQVTAVQQQHQAFLLSIPHVVGIGIGYATAEGTTTQELSLVVMVDQKLPDEAVAPEHRIPKEIDGVRVDVQETGAFTAGLSAETF